MTSHPHKIVNKLSEFFRFLWFGGLTFWQNLEIVKMGKHMQALKFVMIIM